MKGTKMIGETIPRHHESSTSRAEHCGGGRHRRVGTVKRRVHAVLLGGWSPGPLQYLSSFFSHNMTTRRSRSTSTTTTSTREKDPTSPSSVAAPSTPIRQYDVDVVDVTPNLPMPPIPSTVWCCCTFNNPRLLMVWIVFGGLIYLLFFLPSIISETPSPSKLMTFRIVVSIITIIWFRYVVVPTVVRVSIDKGIEVALQQQQQQQQSTSSSSQRRLLSGLGSTTTNEDHYFQDNGNEAEDESGPTTTILIGFSWGGAVLAEMVARGLVGGDGQPYALMIAPTTSLVATISRTEDAALRVSRLFGGQNRPAGTHFRHDYHSNVTLDRRGNDGSSLMLSESSFLERVCVVHGRYDAVFCPEQERWIGIPGVNLQIVNDNHVCCQASTVRLLMDILQEFLAATPTIISDVR